MNELYELLTAVIVVFLAIYVGYGLGVYLTGII